MKACGERAGVRARRGALCRHLGHSASTVVVIHCLIGNILLITYISKLPVITESHRGSNTAIKIDLLRMHRHAPPPPPPPSISHVFAVGLHVLLSFSLFVSRSTDTPHSTTISDSFSFALRKHCWPSVLCLLFVSVDVGVLSQPLHQDSLATTKINCHNSCFLFSPC